MLRIPSFCLNWRMAIAALTLAALPLGIPQDLIAAENSTAVTYASEEIEGLNIAYREAGDPDRPTILLLHGFPTSSHMFRELIPELAENYHVIAPDYPGFGASSMPPAEEFEYSFDNIARLIDILLERKGVDEFAAYVMDYGAPVGYRLFEADPTRVTGFIIQNGNAYDEGFSEFWDPFKTYWAEKTDENADALRGFFTLEATQWQFTHGVGDLSAVNPDNYYYIQYLLDRPGNQEVQLELFYDYGTNPGRYPIWQALFREFQPPALLLWGKNDPIFPESGAHPYKRDLTDLEFHLFDTGHFALEEFGGEIAERTINFMDRITGDKS